MSKAAGLPNTQSGTRTSAGRVQRWSCPRPLPALSRALMLAHLQDSRNMSRSLLWLMPAGTIGGILINTQPPLYTSRNSEGSKWRLSPGVEQPGDMQKHGEMRQIEVMLY